MLKGCAETIRNQKPKLAISIFHKPEDMTEISTFIKSLHLNVAKINSYISEASSEQPEYLPR
ncbi:MAG: hypothetical protein IJZ95_09360 [Oscillospiraceae bacterium]|nr:hypothetical protein [Oscillospiraceae bacterium]